LLVAAMALRGTASRPLDGPLALEARFSLPSVASDVDNRLKALLDALVAAKWLHDDCQIVRLVASKRVCHREDLPGVDVSLWQTETDALTARRLKTSKKATS
jgi:Holliday junction resolvase RusA-like endonuclease